MADYAGFKIDSSGTLFGLQTAAAFKVDNANVEFGSLGGPIVKALYRGRILGEYVYTAGSAPVGATDVIIVGYK